MESAPLATATAQPVTPSWQWARMAGLTAAQMYAVLAARQQVFAVEQHCAFLDADGHDAHAWHLLGWKDDHATPELAVYLRVIDAGRKYADPSIGRVLTVWPLRRTGLGRALMVEGIARTRRVWPGRRIHIAAQQRLEAFYASFGFRAASEPYMEDGIAHVDMLLHVM